MRIQVTIDDIAKGVKGVSESCPVALAIKRQLNPEGVTVGAWNIDWYQSGKGYWAKLPKDSKVHRFITDFDRGDLVDPFEFELIIDGTWK